MNSPNPQWGNSPQWKPQQNAGMPPNGYPQYPGPGVGAGRQYGSYPPPQQPPTKKGSGCLKWVAIVAGAFILLLIIFAACGGVDDNQDSALSGDATTSEASPVPAGQPDMPAQPSAEPQPDSVESPVAPEPEPESEAVPREHSNALRSAEQYLRISGFSQQGLADQLAFEEYSPEAVQYAVDNVDADWNEQAVRSGEAYLQITSFSPQGLIDQLVFEGYTAEQAQYAADQLF